MLRSATLKAMSLLLVFGLVAATGCSRSDDDESGSGSGGRTEVDPDLGEDLMWDDGACDASKPEVALGMIAPFNAGVISLEDQAIAAEASAEAFNARGGIAGQCIKMVTCDDGADPNKAADCARSNVAAGVVAEVNDSVVAASDVVVDTFAEAGVPRLEGNPAPVAFGSDITYAFGMGGLGNVVMSVPPLVEAGKLKLAIIRADVPGTAALRGILEPMTDAYGAEIVADIPLTVGTSDYSQFVLAAQNAGADGLIMAAGPEEAIQVLRAARQLDTDVYFSLSFGTISRSDVQEFGDFARYFVFNGELPPASIDPEQFPLLAVAVRELAASGSPELTADTLTTASLKSWVYMYALVKILRDAEVTDVTPANVKAALDAATDVDLGGLTPPWTPNRTSEGIFRRVSQPMYWLASWDPETENFVLGDEQRDSVKLLAGQVD